MRLYDLVQKKLDSRKGRINTEGMTMLETEQILGEVLTITDCDLATKKATKTDPEKTFAVLLFSEYPNSYYFGGQVLTDLVSEIMLDSEAFEELQKNGLPIVLGQKKSANGKKYTTVELHVAYDNDLPL